MRRTVSNQSSTAHLQGTFGSLVVPAHSPYDRQLLREHIELFAGVAATLTIDGMRWQLTRRAALDPDCTACTRRRGRLTCRTDQTTAMCIDCVMDRRIAQVHPKRRKAMSKDDLLQIPGKVTELLAGGYFRITGENGRSFTARISGRLRRFHIKVIPGDRVTVAVSPYDPTHGLIVHRG